MSESPKWRHRAQRAVIIFPALAIAVTVSCVSTSQADTHPIAKRTTTTVKKKPVATTVPTKGSASVGAPTAALSMLAKISVQKEQPAGYSRSLFKHWVDADKDGCNTREEVLIIESTSPAQVDAYGCKVIEGNWLSPYDNVAHTNPSELDIDHMIPLKEAWDSGARNWTPSQRQLFANDLSDPRALIAVTAGQNRSKSDRDPSNWIPPNTQYICTYLSEWVAIKFRWQLSMDQSEFGRIKNLLNQSCTSSTIAPSGSSNSATTPALPITATTLAMAPTDSVATSAPAVEETTSPKPAVDTTTQDASGVRQVSPVRCKKAEFGQTGQYRNIPYICSDRRADGSLYVVGYYYWRPA
jgi:hypothetical protein